MKFPGTVCSLVILLLASGAMAQSPEDEELLHKQAFELGMQEIVGSLNAGSRQRMVAALDGEVLIERILGLRLIDKRVKDRFIESLQGDLSPLLDQSTAFGGDEITATLVGVESRGSRGRAIVRYDLPKLQFAYHEYELVLDDEDGLRILDWSDFMWGEKFTDSIGNTLVAASPRPQAVRKMIEHKNIRDQEVFQLTELLKAARDSNIERYVEIINGMDPRLLQERSVVLLSVQMSKNWGNRRMLRAALVQMAQYFPDEPLYSLALLDYYVPSRMYAEAIAGLQLTYAKFGFDDAAMEARLSALTLEMDNDADALAHAERAVELEPGLELAWWSALRARVAMANYASSVEALQQLEQEYGHTLGAAELKRDKTFTPLLASEEFTTWAAARQ
jgi:hypothetical protein